MLSQNCHYKKKGRQCKAGRERFTPYQSKDPSPTIDPTSFFHQCYRKKEEKGKTIESKKGLSSLGQQKTLTLDVEARQSHTIEYRQQDRSIGILRWNKSPEVLRGSPATRTSLCRGSGLPMYGQSTTCNPHWHTRHRL